MFKHYVSTVIVVLEPTFLVSENKQVLNSLLLCLRRTRQISDLYFVVQKTVQINLYTNMFISESYVSASLTHCQEKKNFNIRAVFNAYVILERHHICLEVNALIFINYMVLNMRNIKHPCGNSKEC